MRENLYRSYCLSGTEFAILLYAKKAEEIHTLRFVDGTESKEEYLYSVNDLVNKGILVRKEERLEITSPYDEMISVVADHTAVMIVRAYRNDMGDQCVYYDKNTEKMLAVSMSKRKEKSVLITYMDVEAFVKDHLEMEFLPEKSEAIFDVDGMDRSAFESIVEQIKNSRIIDDVRIVLGVNILQRNMKSEAVLMVLNMPEGMCCVHCKDIQCTVTSYVRELFVNELLKELKGGEEWLQ